MNNNFDKKIAELDTAARQTQLKEKEEAEARQKKNWNFVQVEKKALKQIRDLFSDNATAGKILFILAEKMNRQNAVVCSFKTLSTLTGLSRTSLHNAVKYLKEHRWIDIIKVGTANAYIVNSRVFWQSYGDKKFTVFNATVIASSEEQEDDINKRIEMKHFPFILEKESALVVENDTVDPPVNEELDLF